MGSYVRASRPLHRSGRRCAKAVLLGILLLSLAFANVAQATPTAVLTADYPKLNDQVASDHGPSCVAPCTVTFSSQSSDPSGQPTHDRFTIAERVENGKEVNPYRSQQDEKSVTRTYSQPGTVGAQLIVTSTDGTVSGADYQFAVISAADAPAPIQVRGLGSQDSLPFRFWVDTPKSVVKVLWQERSGGQFADQVKVTKDAAGYHHLMQISRNMSLGEHRLAITAWTNQEEHADSTSATMTLVRPPYGGFHLLTYHRKVGRSCVYGARLKGRSTSPVQAMVPVLFQVAVPGQGWKTVRHSTARRTVGGAASAFSLASSVTVPVSLLRASSPGTRFRLRVGPVSVRYQGLSVYRKSLTRPISARRAASCGF